MVVNGLAPAPATNGRHGSTPPASVNGNGWQRTRPQSGGFTDAAATAVAAAGAERNNRGSMRLQQLGEQERRLREVISKKEAERRTRDSEYSLSGEGTPPSQDVRVVLDQETDQLRREMDQLVREQEAVAREESEQRARDDALDQALEQARRNLISQGIIPADGAAAATPPPDAAAAITDDERMLQERLQRARQQKGASPARGAPLPPPLPANPPEPSKQLSVEEAPQQQQQRTRTRSIQMAPRSLSTTVERDRERDRAVSMALRSLDQIAQEEGTVVNPTELLEELRASSGQAMAEQGGQGSQIASEQGGLRTSNRDIHAADENPIFFNDMNARERDSAQLEQVLLAERGPKDPPRPPSALKPAQAGGLSPRGAAAPEDAALNVKWASEREEEKRREAEAARALEASQREWLRTRTGSVSLQQPPSAAVDAAAASRLMREEELAKADKQARKAKIQVMWLDQSIMAYMPLSLCRFIGRVGRAEKTRGRAPQVRAGDGRVEGASEQGDRRSSSVSCRAAKASRTSSVRRKGQTERRGRHLLFRHVKKED